MVNTLNKDKFTWKTLEGSWYQLPLVDYAMRRCSCWHMAKQSQQPPNNAFFALWLNYEKEFNNINCYLFWCIGLIYLLVLFSMKILSPPQKEIALNRWHIGTQSNIKHSQSTQDTHLGLTSTKSITWRVTCRYNTDTHTKGLTRLLTRSKTQCTDCPSACLTWTYHDAPRCAMEKNLLRTVGFIY